MVRHLILLFIGYCCFATVVYWGARKMRIFSLRHASRDPRSGPIEIGVATPCGIEDPLDGVETSRPPSECVFHTRERDNDEARRLYWTTTAQKCRFRVFLGWRVDKSFVPPERCGSFLLFEHQAGGHACYHRCFFVRPLRVHADFMAFAAALANKYVYHNKGWLSDPSLAEQIAYRQALSRGYYTADFVRIRNLMESVYPFDVSDSNLAGFTPDADRLDVLLDCDVATSGRLGVPTVFVISDNSD